MLRIAVFFSGNASAVQYLLKYDPNRGRLYKFVGAFTDKKNAPGAVALFSAGVPVLSLDFREWCLAKKVAPG